MNLVSTLGIDLAKSTFSLHGVNANGEVVRRRTLSRAKLSELVAQLQPCLIGMEACSGAHEWARRFAASGHTVKLMAAKFVTPYRKSGKNDGNDAEAICEAVTRPNMRFVPVKSLEQQSDLTLHRVRQGFVEERTATLNRLRGLLAEFGHVLPLRAVEVHRRVPQLLDSPGHRTHHRLGAGRHCGQRPRLQKRTAVRRLAGPGSAPVLHRRQDAARAHHQAW